MIGYYCSSMVVQQTFALRCSFKKTYEFNTCCVVEWLNFRLICKKNGRSSIYDVKCMMSACVVSK